MTSKYEQLIELFIAEDEQGAKDLFHEIVVEKSRDIYENITDEDQVEETAEVDEDTVEEDEAVEESDFDEAELGGDAADDMIDDIEADEEGLSLEDEHEGDDDIGLQAPAYAPRGRCLSPPVRHRGAQVGYKPPWGQEGPSRPRQKVRPPRRSRECAGS